MSDSLVQKHLLKGTREFELVDDAVNVRIRSPLNNEEFTVVLSIIDPEPVMEGSMLAFVSIVNREALIELFPDKPDPASFNAFVDKIRQGAIAADYGRPKANSGKQVDVTQLQMTLDMLRAYLAEDDIKSLLDAMEALKSEPDNPARLDALFEAYNDLGPSQGAVLTYAPYIVSLIQDDK